MHDVDYLEELIYTEKQIQKWVSEPKPTAPDAFDGMTTKADDKYEGGVDVFGKTGRKYRVQAWRLVNFPKRFWIAFGRELPGDTQIYWFRTYCGHKDHRRNPIEGNVVTGFHVHRATDRYALLDGRKPWYYAEETDAYTTFAGAMDCMIEECNLVAREESQQQTLFKTLLKEYGK